MAPLTTPSSIPDQAATVLLRRPQMQLRHRILYRRRNLPSGGYSLEDIGIRLRVWTISMLAVGSDRIAPVHAAAPRRRHKTHQLRSLSLRHQRYCEVL